MLKSPHRVSLALEYLSDHLNHHARSKSIMNLEVLRQTLELLEELPAESAVWENDVPEFLESLTALSASKDAERAAVVSRETLAKSIKDFEGTYSEILEYLEVDTSLWHPPLDADNALVERIDSLFGTLESLFNDYDAIPDKGASLSQTRALIERRQAVEDQILGISSELDGLLQTVEEITDDGRPPEPVVEITTTDRLIERHTKSSDATLSELRISEGSLQFDPDRTKYEVLLENGIGIFQIWPVTNTANATIAVTAESTDGHSGELESEHGGYTVSNLKVGNTEISVNITAEDLSTSKTYYVTVSRAVSDNARLESLDLSIGDLRFDTEVTQYEVQIPWDTEELTQQDSRPRIVPQQLKQALFSPAIKVQMLSTRTVGRFPCLSCRKVTPCWRFTSRLKMASARRITSSNRNAPGGSDNKSRRVNVVACRS